MTDHGPAVTDRCTDGGRNELDYPYGNRVPKTVRIVKTEESLDWNGFGVGYVRDLSEFIGNEYPAWTNRYGVVFAVLESGKKLWLLPDEFEVVEWLVVGDSE